MANLYELSAIQDSSTGCSKQVRHYNALLHYNAIFIKCPMMVRIYRSKAITAQNLSDSLLRLIEKVEEEMHLNTVWKVLIVALKAASMPGMHRWVTFAWCWSGITTKGATTRDTEDAVIGVSKLYTKVLRWFPSLLYTCSRVKHASINSKGTIQFPIYKFTWVSKTRHRNSFILILQNKICNAELMISI